MGATTKQVGKDHAAPRADVVLCKDEILVVHTLPGKLILQRWSKMKNSIFVSMYV